MTKRNDFEHYEQVSFMKWVKLNEKKYPQLLNLTAFPAGGIRTKKTGAKLKREGLKAGYPDVLLDWPSGNYHGLRIEMKYGKNKPTKLQTDWHERLKNAGYRVNVCYSWSEAVAVIKDYLKIK